MSGPGRRIVVAVAAAVAVAALAGAVAFWPARPSDTRAEPAPAAVPSVEPSGSPEPAGFELVVDLGRVRGRGVRGPVAGWRLAGPRDAVLRTMTELYSIGFVDPDRWDAGRFPGLVDLFVGAARREARDDVRPLSLGPSARRLAVVQPQRARLDVRFLVGAGRQPIVAFARFDFAGVGVGSDEEVDLPIRHRGRYVLRPSDGAWRIAAYDVRSRVPSPGEIRREAAEARAAPSIPSRKPFFLLVIGSDARPGQSVTRSRADSLHIVGVNPKRRAASIVGIPRDSLAFIPGVGTRKINESLVRGGPELTVKTVEGLTGVRIDAYVLTGFEGFKRLVGSVGGLQVQIPYRMADRYSRAYFQPGRKRLSGKAALAFSRNRHDAPGGDFGRSLNQGVVMMAAFQELRSELRKDPAAVSRWILAGARHLHTDLSLVEMTELLLAARSIEPGRVRNRVVSGSGAMVGGASVVRLGAAAHAIFRDLRTDGVLGGHRRG